MLNSHLDSNFLKMIKNILNSTNKITVFLGAGCSLTSSEKDITTYGIIEDLVEKHSLGNEPIPDNWIELYSKFVNDIWAGQGEKNRIGLLEGYFENMTPSIGYETIRWLVENDYIQNIITTNFDLMLDRALDGINYNLIVGTQNIIVDKDAKLTIIKAHGDLRHGELRFSPEELKKLPKKLENEICECSKGTLIVIGFKGQDGGVMDALDTSGEYNLYWTSLKELDILNNYDNYQILNLMKKRKSEPNFLYGDKYGNFDELLTNIKSTIEIVSHNELEQQKNKIGKLWKDCTYIFDKFNINKRFLFLFQILFRIVFEKTYKENWQIKAPYFAGDFESILKNSITLLSDEILTEKELSCINNEVDSLLFSFSFSINIAALGYNVNPIELIESIKSEYNNSNNSTQIGNEFWEKSKIIANTEIEDISFVENVKKEPIKFSFDNGDNLQTILKYVDVKGMQSLLSTIRIILIFNKTSVQNTQSVVLYQYKQKLEQSFYSINSNNDKIIINISKMSLSTYNNIYNSILCSMFVQYDVDDERILKHGNISVTFYIDKTDYYEGNTIFENILSQSESFFINFLNGFNTDDIIKREHVNVLDSFLAAQSNGLFIVGNSGSGKTTTLQLWARSLDSVKYVVYPFFGRELNIKEINDHFLINFNDEELSLVNVMLEQRQQVLVIIIDAINEISASFSDIKSLYLKMLEFCNNLAKNKLTRIKIVLSSRSEFYSQLLLDTDTKPSESSFYSLISKDCGEESSTVFEIPLLSFDEVNSFINVFGRNKNVTYNHLINEFGSIITLPFNLKLICSFISPELLNNKELSSSIFDAWFESLKSQAEKEHITIESAIAIIYKVLQYKYLDASYNDAHTYRLFSEMKAIYSNTVRIYEWLVTQNIFVKSDSQPNVIKFSHDKIEEFFFGKLISEKYKNYLNNIESFLNKDALTKPIVTRGLENVINECFHDDLLKFTNDTVNIIKHGSDYILSIWFNVIFNIASNEFEPIYNFYKNIEQYLTKSDYTKFINSNLANINSRIDSMSKFNINIINIVCKVIETSNCSEDITLVQYSKYLKAKYLYTFADGKNTDAFKDSLLICESITRSLDDNSDSSFIDSLNYLKALLLQNKGDLNDAIILMKRCYDNQTKKGAFDFAIKSAIYLGAMYREMTMFDEAIELYNDIKIEFISNAELEHRLLMNKGIIYKNKIQNNQFEGIIQSQINEEYYNTALNLFNNTYIYALKSDNVKLMLEICAEFVELSCIAYYMGIGTIEEAQNWGEKLDKYIPRCDVPVERIQRLRMWARIYVLSCNFEKAIKVLEKGYKIATDYNIPFRASDCCNQITGIVCDMIDRKFDISVNILEKAVYYGNYAMNYYKSLNNPEHRYLKDTIIKINKIKNYIANKS